MKAANCSYFVAFQVNKQLRNIHNQLLNLATARTVRCSTQKLCKAITLCRGPRWHSV